MTTEIRAQELDAERFIEEKVDEIRAAMGEGMAINALSGGVDSSTVTMLGHRALGSRLRTVFVQNGLMREGEPDRVVSLFKDLGVKVEFVDAQTKFFSALSGLTDPEERREAVTQTSELLSHVASEIIRDVPGVVSVTHNIAPKPPSTIEAI